MTVSQLIEELKKYDPNAEIVVLADGWQCKPDVIYRAIDGTVTINPTA